MLYRSCNIARLREIIALVAANVGSRHGSAEICVFTSPFDGSAPARIAADVNHRGVKPANTRGSRLFCSHVREVNDELRIEARGQAQGYRIDGAKTVNDIRAEEQRDVQAAPVNGKMLISVGALRADGIEHRAKPASGSQIHGIHMIGGFRVHGSNPAAGLRTRQPAQEPHRRYRCIAQAGQFFLRASSGAAGDPRALQFLDRQAGHFDGWAVFSA